ncbi:MAG: hypothetical protein ACQEQE_03510 [Bacillota bacterium]
MINQKNRSKVNFLIVTILSIIFFYLSYLTINLSRNLYIQLAILFIIVYIFLNGIYKILPDYEYKLIDNELIIIRKFSERYQFSYKIFLEDICSIDSTSHLTLKFWNQFYNLNRKNEIYTIKYNNQEIKFDPKNKLVKEIQKRVNYEKD